MHVTKTEIAIAVCYLPQATSRALAAGSRFDVAGRVVKKVPAPANLGMPGCGLRGSPSAQIG